MRVLLIDGDILCRRAAHGAASRGGAAPAQEAEAAARVARQIELLKARLRGDRMLAALGEGGSFRRRIAPSYKAARRRRTPPIGLAAARRRLSELIETRSVPGLEADDLLGVWATAPDLSFAAADPDMERKKRLSGPRLIVSEDKDLLSIPGLHGAASGAVRRVSADEAEARHLAQTLMGDSADGYRGCPGIGPKRALGLLAVAGARPWNAVLSAFSSAGLGPDAALREARLARILRYGEVDDEAMTPRLWSPDRLRLACDADLARRAIAPFLAARAPRRYPQL